MSEFTKEQLAEIASDRHAAKFVPLSGLADLAAFALAQMERAENAEAERDRLRAERDEERRELAAERDVIYDAEKYVFEVTNPEPDLLEKSRRRKALVAAVDNLQMVRRARKRGKP